jgi:RNA polymerase sigma-70 factor, ECF subfamily
VAGSGWCFPGGLVVWVFQPVMVAGLGGETGAEARMSECSGPQLRGLAAGGGVAGGGGADVVVAGLYREYGGFVLGYVTGLLGDRFLAEDVVQETMLRAWRHCGELSAERGSVRGWLVRVAHNVAMDMVRMRRSRPAEVAEGGGPEPVVADHADAVVTAVQVRGALGRLSASHRAVIEEIYLNGCTAREAAARLGIPEGTAFSRSFYALRVLRAELGAVPGAGPGAVVPGGRAAAA